MQLIDRNRIKTSKLKIYRNKDLKFLVHFDFANFDINPFIIPCN